MDWSNLTALYNPDERNQQEMTDRNFVWHMGLEADKSRQTESKPKLQFETSLIHLDFGT